MENVTPSVQAVTAAPSSTDLAPVPRKVVVHPTTGEAYDLDALDAETVAFLAVEVEEAAEKVDDARAMLSDRLVAEMDRNALWTQRYGDPSGPVQLEVTSSAPTAGTDEYPPKELENLLEHLVQNDVLTESAANAALTRAVVVTLSVPYNWSVSDIKNDIKGAGELTIGAVKLGVLEVEEKLVARKGGIGALQKIPAVAELLAKVVRKKDPAHRKAKIKRVER